MRPGIVLPVVPALRTLLECFVVPFLVFFDGPLETDVSPNLIAELITLQQQQQTRHATIPVAERMNTQEIKIHRRHRDRGMNHTFINALVPGLDQGSHRGAGLSRGNGAKPDAHAPVR
jgi:hypothetical protein